MRPLDVMPATVTFSDGTAQARSARVYVADGRGRIFVEGRLGAVEVLREAEVARVEGKASRNNPAKVITADGQVWEVRRRGGCGCGSPLKRFSPARWGE